MSQRILLLSGDPPVPDVLSRPILRADHRIPYGPGPQQFGDLWLPAAAFGARLPLVVFFHGGWWKSEYDLGYAGYLCAALKHAGIACWSVEYRRVGSTGGGWPATFQDAAAGLDYVATLAQSYPLDLARVVTVGHSAGGHLGFWVAGRHHLDPASALQTQPPQVPLLGCIALAGGVDLRLAIDLSGNLTFPHHNAEIFALLGGTPAEHPDRYREANPGDLLPFGIPQLLFQGSEDDQIPPTLPARWAANAHAAGDVASVTILPGADHLDVVDPESAAWPTIQQAIMKMLTLRRPLH